MGDNPLAEGTATIKALRWEGAGVSQEDRGCYWQGEVEKMYGMNAVRKSKKNLNEEKIE